MLMPMHMLMLMHMLMPMLMYMHAVHTAAFTAALASLAAVWLRSDRLRDQIGSDHIGWLSWLAELAGLVNFLGANGIPSVGREPIVESLEPGRGGWAGWLGWFGSDWLGSDQLVAQIGLRYILLVHVCRLSARVTRLSSLIGVGPATAGAAAFMDGG